MTSQPLCGVCGKPLADPAAYVCPLCAEVVGKDLAWIVELAPEVETTIAKLSKFGAQLTAGSGERPLPFDQKAAERAESLKNTLATWARHVSEERGVPVLPLPGELGAQTAARFLGEQLNWLRHREEAPEAFADLKGAARELERLVGRPRDHWYAGTCWADLGELDEHDEPLRCQQELYAPKGARTIRCRECGAEHDADGRREWLLDEARNTLAHAELIARALTALGIEKVTGSRVRNLADRGRLAVHGHDQAGRPMYRVGEVLDLIDEQARMEAERAVKREQVKARREAKGKETAA